MNAGIIFCSFYQLEVRRAVGVGVGGGEVWGFLIGNFKPYLQHYKATVISEFKFISALRFFSKLVVPSSYRGNILAWAIISSTLVFPELWSPTTTTWK